MKKFFGFILAILLVASFGMAQAEFQVISIPINATLEEGIFLSVEPSTSISWASVPLPTSPQMVEEYTICDEGELSIFISHRLSTAHRIQLSTEFANLMQDGTFPANAEGLFWLTFVGTTINFDGGAIDGKQIIYTSDWITGQHEAQLSVKIKTALHPAGLYSGDFVVVVEDVLA